MTHCIFYMCICYKSGIVYLVHISYMSKRISYVSYIIHISQNISYINIISHMYILYISYCLVYIPDINEFY